MNPETKPLPIPSWMLIDSFRYALGRSSYQVGETTDWLVFHWSELPTHAKAVIARDLERAFEDDDADRETAIGRAGSTISFSKRLGWDMDRAAWERVRGCCREGKGGGTR